MSHDHQKSNRVIPVHFPAVSGQGNVHAVEEYSSVVADTDGVAVEVVAAVDVAAADCEQTDLHLTEDEKDLP